MVNKIIIGIVVVLVVALVLGIGISNYVRLSNTPVQVFGTVSPNNVSILYFQNLSGTFTTSAPVANGQYSVLLTGGQTYNVYTLPPNYGASDYKSFYVPLGLPSLKENLVPNS